MVELLGEWKGTLDVGIGGIEGAIFYFMVYSLFGWLIENFYSLSTTGTFFKEGFLKSPLKPMYGFAPLMLLSLVTAETHWLIIFFLCIAIPTLVEYITGFLSENLLHRTWWDYSNLPLQLKGHICLSFSLCWFVLSVLFLFLVHPAMSVVYTQVSGLWTVMAPVFLFIIIADSVVSFRYYMKNIPVEVKE